MNTFFYGYATGFMLAIWINVFYLKIEYILFTTAFLLLLTLMCLILDKDKLKDKKEKKK